MRMFFLLFVTVIVCTPASMVLAVESAPTPAPPTASTVPNPASQPPELAPIGEDIEDWQARWELARLLSYTKRYDESLQQYRKLLEEKPDLTDARVEMATVLAWSGRFEEAARIIEKLPAKELGEEARLALADILIAAKSYAAAEEILRQRLKNAPADDTARLKLAELLSWDKRYDDSLQQYELILENRPEDVQVRRKYAYVLIWAGKRDKAAQELRKSLGE